MGQTDIQTFWNDIGSTKEFTDPFFEEKFSSFLNKKSTILEYGCGYGRILNNLSKAGYENLRGFDFAPKMIERGQKIFPHLSLQLLEEGKAPLADQSVDAIILSTVLCCNPEKGAQEKIIEEIYRLLKGGGILYLCEFLITHSEKYLDRYNQHAHPESADYGIYTTTENVAVRHHSVHWLINILKDFDIQWLEQLDDVTMNGNSVRTVHLIAQKR
jgi:SAM-dependent methyltransferase